MNINYVEYVYPAMAIASLVGVVYFAFRSGLTTLQKQVNDALKDRLDAQDREITELKRENAVQAHDMDLMKSAFEQLGMAITIKGDVLAILNKDGSSAIIKPPPPPPQLRAQMSKPRRRVTRVDSVTTESEQT
jgi:hypothetical protein